MLEARSIGGQEGWWWIGSAACRWPPHPLGPAALTWQFNRTHDRAPPRITLPRQDITLLANYGGGGNFQLAYRMWVQLAQVGKRAGSPPGWQASHMQPFSPPRNARISVGDLFSAFPGVSHDAVGSSLLIGTPWVVSGCCSPIPACCQHSRAPPTAPHPPKRSCRPRRCKPSAPCSPLPAARSTHTLTRTSGASCR